jgi:hypothetical protein
MPLNILNEKIMVEWMMEDGPGMTEEEATRLHRIILIITIMTAIPLSIYIDNLHLRILG